MFRFLLKVTGAYNIYEKWLRRQIEAGPIPYHVGLILDGGKWWLKDNTTLPKHETYVQKIWDLIKWCKEFGIRILTIYVFSLEGFREVLRSKDTLEIIRREITNLDEKHRLQKEGIKIKFIGRIDLFPKDIVEKLNMLEDVTKNNNSLIVNIAVAYGGKIEIVDAARKVAMRVKSGELSIDRINEEIFQTYLYTSHLANPNVDLIIRTSSERRLIGFLLWQSAYSEFVFLDVYWPDFRKIDFMRAIRIFQRRKRRFGR